MRMGTDQLIVTQLTRLPEVETRQQDGVRKRAGTYLFFRACFVSHYGRNLTIRELEIE